MKSHPIHSPSRSRSVRAPLAVAAIVLGLCTVSTGRDLAESSSPETAQIWSLLWDDVTDGTLDPDPKVCEVALTGIDECSIGSFHGPVLGAPRTALFSGERSTVGRIPIWWLEQREPGYVCRYQLTPGAEGIWTGTWVDSEGRSGDVLLEPGAPTPAPAPGLRLIDFLDSEPAPPVRRVRL